MAVTKIVRSLKKSGKKTISYRAEVYSCGVKIADRVFPTATAARDWHDRTKSKIAKGYAITKTFGEMLHEYLNGPFLKLRKSTQQGKAPRIKYLRDCPLTTVKLDDLGPMHVSSWLEWLNEQEKGHRRESFHEELAFLNTVLTWYRESQDPSFVVPILKRHRTKDIYFKQLGERRPDYYMRPEEVRGWLDAMSKRRDDTFYFLSAVMIYTGLRVGEAAGLCWDAVDLAGRVPSIRVARALAWDRKRGNQPYFQPAKNRTSYRQLPIPEVLIGLLTDLKNQQGVKTIEWIDEENHLGTYSPLFLNSDDQPLWYDRIRYHFKQGFEAIGVDFTGTHIARHTFATLSLQATRDLTGIQAAMGHSTQKQTQEYAKVISLEFGGTLQRTAEFIACENHSQMHSQVLGETENPLENQGVGRNAIH